MPRRDYEQEFWRELVNSSELHYVRKMRQFYDRTLQDLWRMLGKKTEFNVTVTTRVLEKIEERLSEFEEKEKDLIDNYRKCVRETEGVAF